MKYVILDCETTGLFDFSQRADAEGQPRLASLGLFIVDEQRRVIGAESWYVQPDGWSMSEEAGKVNGLTDEFLMEHGEPVELLLSHYADMIDEGHVISTYNSQYDTKIMRGEMRRAGMDDRFEQTNNLCLMRACTDICKVPRAKGKGYKWPTLAEACDHFNIWNPDKHSAVGDALAALQVFFKLDALGLLPEGEIHYAKNPPA